MEIMLIEDEQEIVAIFRREFKKMPEASLTVVMNSQEYPAHAGRRFDAYICDNSLDEPSGPSSRAFRTILPDIFARFPDAILMHNSSVGADVEAEAEEKQGNFRFARGADGKRVFCEKNPKTAVCFLRTMVADRDKSMKPPAQPPIPAPERRKI